MAIKVRPLVPGDWLRSEALNQRSRKVLTVLSGQVIKCGQVVVQDSSSKAKAVSATGNEIHTFTATGTPTSGTFRISVWHYLGYWVQTTAIPFDCSEAVAQAAVNQALLAADSGAVTVTLTGEGTAVTAAVITFSGTNYASKSFPIGQIDFSDAPGITAFPGTRSTSAGAAQNEVQKALFGAAATAGTVRFGVAVPQTGLPIDRWPIVWTDTAAWSATDATYLSNINTALDAVLGAGSVVATAIAATDTDLGFVFTFSGTGFLGIAHPFIQVDTTELTGVTTVVMSRTTAGGVAGNREGNKAVAIAFEAVDATAGDTSGLFLVREAVIDKDAIIYGGGDPDACITALEELSILALDEPTNMFLPVLTG